MILQAMMSAGALVLLAAAPATEVAPVVAMPIPVITLDPGATCPAHDESGMIIDGGRAAATGIIVQGGKAPRTGIIVQGGKAPATGIIVQGGLEPSAVSPEAAADPHAKAIAGKCGKAKI